MAGGCKVECIFSFEGSDNQREENDKDILIRSQREGKVRQEIESKKSLQL